ncbi:hypothetical protein VULLAG_LOCUS1500 [Vulpes lagopus]
MSPTPAPALCLRPAAASPCIRDRRTRDSGVRGPRLRGGGAPRGRARLGTAEAPAARGLRDQQQPGLARRPAPPPRAPAPSAAPGLPPRSRFEEVQLLRLGRDSGFGIRPGAGGSPERPLQGGRLRVQPEPRAGKLWACAGRRSRRAGEGQGRAGQGSVARSRERRLAAPHCRRRRRGLGPRLPAPAAAGLARRAPAPPCGMDCCGRHGDPDGARRETAKGSWLATLNEDNPPLPRSRHSATRIPQPTVGVPRGAGGGWAPLPGSSQPSTPTYQ